MRLLAHNDGQELRGNERQLVHLAAGLRGRGHDVLVACRSSGALARELPRAGVATTGIRPRGDLALASVLRFRRLVARRSPDAVLLTSWKRVLSGAWAARRGGTPRVIVRLGIVRRMPARGTAAWKLRRAFGRYVDALVVNSDAVARVWLESAPWFPPERLRVIRNGVDAVTGDAAVLRHELGVPDGARLVISVAALESRKGLDLLVRALARLPADVHGVIAGDGREAGSLRALAASLGLEPRVHWLGARTDVPDVLAGSHAFVLPSRQDSISNALLEAMASGVPVVTTTGNGAEEAIGAVGNRPPAGWIVPADDPSSLAEAVTSALAVGDARRQEALWRAKHWFGVERMVAEYERVLFG